MQELEQEFCANHGFIDHSIVIASTKQQSFLKMLINNFYPDEEPFSVVKSFLPTNATAIEELSVREITRLIHLVDPKPDTIFVNEHPIISNGMFEIGYQPEHNTIRNMYYIKFYDVLCLDIDTQSFDAVQEKLNIYKNVLTFKIYKTKNGYHLYCVSRPFTFNDQMCYKLQTTFGCDKMYIRFSMYNGYKIRLSKKQIDEPFIEQYIGMFGDAPIIPDLETLVQYKDALIVANAKADQTMFSIEELKRIIRDVPSPVFKNFEPFISFANDPLQ